MKISHLCSMMAITVTMAAGLASAQTTTLKGTVTDQMCGAHHMMAGASAQKCTRECVGMGSAYALIVGDKVYTLQANTQVKKELYTLAGETAVIQGTVSGTTVQVTSAAAGK